LIENGCQRRGHQGRLSAGTEIRRFVRHNHPVRSTITTKNEATKAAINNADWLFLLRQKPENIDRLGKEGKLSLDEWLKRQLDP